LTYKAQQLGYHPEVILAGRRINDNMSIYVVSRIIKMMLSHGLQPLSCRVLMLGLTFKENCPDVRNTKAIDVHRELSSYGRLSTCRSSRCGRGTHEYGVEMTSEPDRGAYDVVVLTVAHRQFREMGVDGIRAFGKPGALLYDVKYLLPADASDDRL
jgi:UDP-N-acetyl-D-galactosamine dehydrogenase